MPVGWPQTVDPSNLGTVTCIEYGVYRYRVKLQCLTDLLTKNDDEELVPMAETAVTQITNAWQTIAKMTRIIQERRDRN